MHEKSDASKPTILVVDDELSALTMAKALLDDDFDVTTASSVAEAKAHLRKTKFSVALVDYHMPGENGAVLIDHLMEFMPFDNIFVVTADQSQHRMGKVINYVEKPYDPRILLKMLQTITDRNNGKRG